MPPPPGPLTPSRGPFDLDALAADCAADGMCEMLFVAPPLPIAGAVNSPINPLAVK